MPGLFLPHVTKFKPYVSPQLDPCPQPSFRCNLNQEIAMITSSNPIKYPAQPAPFSTNSNRYTRMIRNRRNSMKTNENLIFWQ